MKKYLIVLGVILLGNIVVWLWINDRLSDEVERQQAQVKDTQSQNKAIADVGSAAIATAPADGASDTTKARREGEAQANAVDADHASDEGEHFSREEVEHEFGTKPEVVFFPEKFVDTDAMPSAALKAEAKADAPLHFYQVNDNTYFLYGNIAEVDENNRGWNGNAGFVVTDEGVVVIDALGTPKLGQRMIATIRAVTDKPIKYLIVTHNHPDHAYGAIAFKALEGVSIIAHEGTMKYLESESIERSVAYRETFIKSDMEGFKAVKPDVMVGGDLYSYQRITLGDRNFDIYNTGDHHSYGDLVIHQVEDNIVWISDLAFNNRVTFMADGHSQKAIEAQTWLLEKFADAQYMIPGHGSVQTAPFPMVTRTRSYMQRLRDAMAEAVENDIDMMTAVDKTEFEDWRAIPMYGLNQRPNANFVYREMEEELF